MPLSPFSSAAAAALALALAPVAVAQVPTWSFGGYGTLGVVRSDEERADYLVDAFKPSGPGHTREWNPEVDSRLGAQATASFTPTLAAVVQVIVQQRHDESWEPVVEWANLKWQPIDELSLRAGRVVLPVFMVTDSRRVGYANPWVRPPVEVYSLVPITSSDGLDVSWWTEACEGRLAFQLTLGRSDAKFPDASGFDAGSAEVRRIAALVATFERGPFTARVNYGEARLTIAAFEPYFDAFRQFGPEGTAIAERYSVNGRKVDFLGFGAHWDPGAGFATAEWARFDTHSIIGSRTAWYVSGGLRRGAWTPYATYARLRANGDRSHPGLTLPGMIPAPLVPVAAQLNAALNQQLALAPVQETLSLGVRWDFRRNAALKLQYDVVDVGAGSPGTFGRIQPGFERGGRAGIFSAALDFVF
jgi:hypothetical protein